MKKCPCKGIAFFLRTELPHDLNMGDEVTLSQDGYIIKCAPRDTKHLLEGYPYHLKENEGYLVTCNRLEPIGFFKGYYFVEESVKNKNDITNLQVYDKWEANTKSPEGFVPICIVATKQDCKENVGIYRGNCMYVQHMEGDGKDV